MKHLKFTFTCFKCNSKTTTEVILPRPDMLADVASEGEGEHGEHVYCENCDEELEATVFLNIYEQPHVDIEGGEVDENSYYIIRSGIDAPDYWDELEWIIGYAEHHKNYQKSIASIESLLELRLTNQDAGHALLRMAYVNVITSMETYLSGTFIHIVTTSRSLLRRFIETAPEFKDHKFQLSEIFSVYDEIQETAASHLNDIIFHNIGKVKPMYKQVLGIDFGDISWLGKAVNKRHDLVHRNGYDKQGSPVEVSLDEIRSLIRDSNTLIGSIEQHLPQE